MNGNASVSSPLDISVVMSVCNGSDLLAKAVNSILSQEGVSLELIVVNDGSIDGSCATILDEYARRDPRVRVIHQENTGLTRALIRGCAAARGQFIARQDSDDISLPGRLASGCASEGSSGCSPHGMRCAPGWSPEAKTSAKTSAWVKSCRRV